MLGRINYGCLILVVTGAILLPAARPAHAQSPAVVCVLSRGTDGRLCPGSPWAVWPAYRVSSRSGLPVCSHDDLLRTSRRNHDVLPVGECRELLPVGAASYYHPRPRRITAGECHELLPVGAAPITHPRPRRITRRRMSRAITGRRPRPITHPRPRRITRRRMSRATTLRQHRSSRPLRRSPCGTPRVP